MAAEKKSSSIKKGQGGARPGAGRKKGSPNKHTQEVRAKIEASGMTPLEYMLKVMRDEGAELKDRLTAAQAAAPYVHAKLSAITVSGDPDNPLKTISRVELVALDG